MASDSMTARVRPDGDPMRRNGWSAAGKSDSAVIGGDDDGAAVVEAEVAQAIEQRPHRPQRALRLRQVARAGQPRPPAGVDALRIGGDRRVRRDQVQERVHGSVAGGGDPTRELLQEHRVPE